MRPWILPPLFVLTLFDSGCLSAVYDESESDRQSEAGAEIEADVDESMSPQPLPLEGTPTAFGMLRVANELGMSALDGEDEVGLDERAARSILAYRAGNDGYIGTADDRYVDRIATLDDLHWMGEANLWAIQRYALREGFVVDALPEASCDPVLAEAIDDCLTFVEHEAEAAVSREDVVPSCLVDSDPRCPSSAFFSAVGVTDVQDPMLGYYALLCDSQSPPALCDLGVAGLAMHLGPHCDARFDPS